MNSPVNQILQAYECLSLASFHKWIGENAESIIEAERKMVALAYVAGIDMDWGSDPSDVEDDATRDPKYGYEYFDYRYGKE